MLEHDEESVRSTSPRVERDTKKEIGEARAAQRALAGNPSQGGLLHLQRAAGNASVSSLLNQDEPTSSVLDTVGSGGGQPLDRATRTEMEAAFGHAFGDVRVHTGGEASRSAESVQAQAYTVGSDIVFQGDHYAPDTAAGKRMLAHELTHVVQQRSGPVEGTPKGGGVSVSHPDDRFERAAERTADRVMNHGHADTTSMATIQRETDETSGVEAVIQRQAAPEEEEEELQA